MRGTLILSALLMLSLIACTATPGPIPVVTTTATNAPPRTTETSTPPGLTQTASMTPTEAISEAPAPSATPVSAPTNTALPTVENLKASVSADLLSCRYGPGPEYLYLFAFRRGANIELIGRVDARNWKWVLVENQVPCWVHANFLDVQGDIMSLPVVYPEIAKLPITPYYPRSSVLSAKRDNQRDEVTVSWVEVPVSPGDYEDESMQTYIVEVWRCEQGQLLFDPLATRLTFITFVDEPGCSEPSHGRVWVQEKHGYAGPAEIPWPAYSSP